MRVSQTFVIWCRSLPNVSIHVQLKNKHLAVPDVAGAVVGM